MKTFFTKLLTHFEAISNPAGAWFSKSTTTTETKKSGSKKRATQSPSPDSYNVRGRSSKKSNSIRRTIAPGQA